MNTKPDRKCPLVLVVDDDETIRLLVRATLEQAGYLVEEAVDGIKALAAMKYLKPDIMLLDVVMPNMDGFQVCSEMKKVPSYSSIPIAIMTGLDDTESINRAYSMGVTSFITKPIKWSILGHHLNYILQSSRTSLDLRKSESQLVSAQQIAQLANWEWSISNDIIKCSEGTYNILGLPTDGSPITLDTLIERVHPDDSRLVEGSFQEAVREGKTFNIEHRIVRTDGIERIVCQKTEITLNDEGRAELILATVQDITERKRSEDRIQFLAYHDSLTNLPNRLSFDEFLNRELINAKHSEQIIAILFLDIDDFKRINDSYGHRIGDILLRSVAERLRSAIRSDEFTTRQSFHDTDVNMARFGGDEFILLLNNTTNIHDATYMAKRVHELLSHPFDLEISKVYITVSIGIVIYPFDGEDSETLIKNADLAMYKAKEKGKNNFKFFAKSLNVKAVSRLMLENNMRKALEKKEFLLHYQPKICLKTGNITGLEALVRWQDPDRGLVQPAEFIPLAEECGLIGQIGEWVLRKACEQIMSWKSSGYDNLSIAVNISGQQFKNRDLVKKIQDIIIETGVSTDLLELEITESTLMQLENTRTVQQLKSMGITMAIDDFGTGYSSLNCLKRLPIDVVKIDLSFVKDIVTNKDDASIVTAIIRMTQSLKLKVVAEGVETREQLALLREKGCDEAQGYLIARPMPAEEVLKLIQSKTGNDILSLPMNRK